MAVPCAWRRLTQPPQLSHELATVGVTGDGPNRGEAVKRKLMSCHDGHKRYGSLTAWRWAKRSSISRPGETPTVYQGEEAPCSARLAVIRRRQMVRGV